MGDGEGQGCVIGEDNEDMSSGPLPTLVVKGGPAGAHLEQGAPWKNGLEHFFSGP